MKVSARTEQLIMRLRGVVWEESLVRNGSRIALMREYPRRSALWAQALDRMEQWPFFDIAAAVDPEAQVDEELLGSVLDSLEGLPDPFEPLLAVHERGGSFGRKAGSIRIGPGDGIPDRAPEAYARCAPADDPGRAALDALDRSWEERRDEAARRVREADRRRG